MKSSLILLGLLFIEITVFCQNQNKKDYEDCIKKIKSERSVKCDGCKEYMDSFRVFLVNICSDTLDIRVAVQNRSKTWKIFEKNRFRPNDTIAVFSCDGTGKFLKWAKIAGDTTRVFPVNMIMPKNMKNDTSIKKK